VLVPHHPPAGHAAGGGPVEIVQMILGHSSPAVSRRVYAHLMRKATTAQVEAALAGLAERPREQSVGNPLALLVQREPSPAPTRH
jgi:hypothetical protein